MIYIDPPYGIKYGSNFQPEVARREVKETEEDFTRELEMVKAYRDTWHIGIHSYLTYVRDRLLVARELLSDSGSLFVQIGDENVHLVRSVLDEVFQRQNFIAEIVVTKTAGLSMEYLDRTCDFILWYAKNADKTQYLQLFIDKRKGRTGTSTYRFIELPSLERRTLSADEVEDPKHIPPHSRLFSVDALTSQTQASTTRYVASFRGQQFHSGKRQWATPVQNLERLIKANRVEYRASSMGYVRYFDDFPVMPLRNVWDDTGTGSFTESKVYVVQTGNKVIERCILMTTDPGDLVLDPTCGSGTTAFVSEQLGRRWITIDISRVALAIARQRLLTAKYEFYQLLDEKTGVAGGFKYKSVPHITLKSIAQNQNLNPIFAKHEPILEKRLAECNSQLVHVTSEQRRWLEHKLIDKERYEGKRAVTDADRRRWLLPEKGQTWEHWTVPLDTDPDYPQELIEAVTACRKAWRVKMDEVNACIAANAEQEELVDQPEVVRGITRVSGPFTVEAVLPKEADMGESPIGGEPEEYGPSFLTQGGGDEARNSETYLDQMIRLLRMDGVRFPNNKEMRFSRLERLTGNAGGLHAEGRWAAKGEPDADQDGRATVAIALGPQYGPVTAMQVEDLIRTTNRRGYDDLVVAGFSFDGPAQAIIEEAQHPRLRIHIAHIRPDVNPAMAGLLKEQPGSQLFTVFGQPRTTLLGPNSDGEYKVHMQGVDIYDPVTNTIRSTEDQKVAAWFLDSDYDGRTFCMTQAFFPDKSAWEKLSKALGGLIDPDRFEALSGTVSLPFPVGKHRSVAVKVIDPRGNEVMQVHSLS